MVTTVPFSHATPACLGAHNVSRNHYAAIAREMVLDSPLDLIMGCGHPAWDDDGKAREDPSASHYKYVGGRELWDKLLTGTTGRGWTLIQTKAQFEALAADASAAPERLIGIPQCHQTLQQKRKGKAPGHLNPNVPSLATMVTVAMRFLQRGEDGFLLVVEGGAVDWANHANNLARMVEEQVDFNRAVEAAVARIESSGGWEKTLLIVTSDHECGQIWGPQAGPPATFQEPVNRGAGNLPDAKHFSKGHTNHLVPLYAKGPGAEGFAKRVRGRDPKYGPYVDNTDVFTVLRAALVPVAEN